MFLNLHSHNQTDYFTLRNIILSQDNELFISSEQDGIFSVGIHPWFIDENDYQSQKNVLTEWCAKPSVIAVGESGLDRLRGPDLETQKTVFVDHIELAEKLSKPLILHCVKCYSEIMGIMNELKPKIPFIFHGFNNNEQIADQLLAHDCYFSLGKALSFPDSNASKLLRRIDLDRLFLESDYSELPIEEIYKLAADQRNISTDKLKEVIFANWKKVGLLPSDKVYEK
ncbi:hypothetical protein GS399_14755 [Pedobacter sp. HMF7647]|uniref:Uncharacterized protein n=1 Tax=Hufsiella arboris TaxID=2695275 RepID=A0A7K1YCC3_9SPHI|nr:TatD family hydrolase [Hufsiella arboris]MXV52236.1 hypothetical protein [Hufsiella arboris]